MDDRNHSYTSIIEEREEGGTPDIIGSIRCALVFKLKQDVGASLISRIEETYRDRALEYWSKNPNLFILGPGLESIREGGVHKLAFFSFLVKHGDMYLHHSFVSLLLNDLFGIQTRGGCACAGPYGQELLGITHEKASELEEALLRSYRTPISLTHLKPGWTRLNLNYFFDDLTVDFVLKAVDFVATHGWKFLPYYVFNEKSNEWIHRRFDSHSSSSQENLKTTKVSSIHENFSHFLEQHRKRLSSVTFIHGNLEFIDDSGELHDMEPNTIHSYSAILEDVESLLEQSMELFTSGDEILKLDYNQEITRLFGDKKYDFGSKYGHLRWYLLPSQALMELQSMKNPERLTTQIHCVAGCLVKPKHYPTTEEYVNEKLRNHFVYSSHPCSSLSMVTKLSIGASLAVITGLAFSYWKNRQ